MNLLRFFDREDAAQPNPVRIGEEGFELVRAAAGGLQIVPTFIVGAQVFNSYQFTGQLNVSVISDAVSFAAEAKAAELIIRPTSAEELIGLPGSEQTAVDRNHMRYLIERIYRSWNSPRTKVYRESHHLPDDRTYPSVIVQVPRSSRTLSLSTRNPRTGTLTAAEDYRYNVNNRIPRFRSEYHSLICGVEAIRGRPSQIEFQEDGDGLHIVRLGAQVMSGFAMLVFASDQHAAGNLSDVQALSILEPGMLGGAVSTSYTLGSDHSHNFQGIVGSPGLALGRLVWQRSSIADVMSQASILVAREISPDDLNILIKCVGAFSTRGGATSHLGDVSRRLGIPAVVGVEELEVDVRKKAIYVGGEQLPANFAFAAVDGYSGIVSLGSKPQLRATRKFENSSPMSLIDWVDTLARLLVDRGEFATLPVPLQTHIAMLRNMITKIRAGYD